LKKLLYLFSALALVFPSCSPAAPAPVVPAPVASTPVLVTRTIETLDDGSTFTSEYEYLGTKIVKTTDDEGYTTCDYTGDLITEFKYYESSILVQTEKYEYDINENIITYTIIDNIDTSWGNKETYTYNANGTISVNYYIGDAFSQTTLNKTGTISFVGGEVSQITFNQGGVIRTRTYTYDNKNNPFINVTGLDKIAFCGQVASGNLHNITQEDDSDDSDNYTYTYNYNSNNYPINESETAGYSGEVTTTQFFYNQ